MRANVPSFQCKALHDGVTVGQVRWLAVVGLVACGRVGFDARTDGGGGGGGGGDGDGKQLPVANRAFVTSTTQIPGELGGAAGADAVCAARAGDAGLTGHFVAWVSTSTQDAHERLRGARGWTRVDGLPVVDTVDDLVEGRMIYPIRLDEGGRDLGGDDTYRVATGTYEGYLNSNCDDFTDPGVSVMTGYQFLTSGAWTNTNTVSCAQPARLYCFQIDLDVRVSIVPASGRTAFVSTGLFLPSSGIGTADALCASEAGAAGLTGTFRALLPTSQPAAARFDVTGPTWVRTDGVTLAASATDLMAGEQLAPLNIRVDRTFYAQSYVLTGVHFGSAFGDPDPAFTCDQWTNPNGDSVLGESSSTVGSAFDITTWNCTDSYPVYCLEQ